MEKKEEKKNLKDRSHVEDVFARLGVAITCVATIPQVNDTVVTRLKTFFFFFFGQIREKERRKKKTHAEGLCRLVSFVVN